MSELPPYAEAVAAWQRHLGTGATTTWREFRGRGEAAPPDGVTPDATHLELVRRLNALPGVGDGLRDLVLRTPSPGRGWVEAPLARPGETRLFGTPPVEPEDLPEEELIRLATGVLARLVPLLPPAPGPQRSTRWPLPWRRRVRVHGSPGSATAVRRMLVEQGAVESDWRPCHVVVARPVEVMLAEHWAGASRAGAIVKWSTLWRRAEAHDRLPGAADVARTVARLAAAGAREVHVVVARDLQHAAAQAARVTGLREVALESAGELSQTDLVRRLNRLTSMIEGPARVRDLDARLLAHVLPHVPAPDHVQAPFVPPAAQEWAREAAARTAERIREAGYPVHGDLDALAPSPGPAGLQVVDRARTLEVALHACATAWRLEQEGP